MREARKRKAVSYAESTSDNASDADDNHSVASVADSIVEDSESEESMDVDDSDDESVAGDDVSDNDAVGSDDDSGRKKEKSNAKKAASAKSPAAKSGAKKASVSTVSKASPARAKSSASAAKKPAVAPTKVSSSAVPRASSANAGTSLKSTSNSLGANCTASGSVPSVSAGQSGNSSSNNSAIGDITQGPPVTTDAGAKKLIAQYMRQQNRPYSAQQVFDNLHKRIPKATLERVLGLLSSPGEGLLCKEYGKAKIYYVDQSFLPAEKSTDQLQDLQQVVLDLQEDLKVSTQSEREKKQQLSALRAQPDDRDLDRLVAEVEERVSAKRQKVETLQAATAAGPQLHAKTGKGGKVLANGGPMSLDQAMAQFNNKRKAWLERKALCMNAVDVLSDAMNKKRQELMSILDIETDEAAGVSIPAKL